MTKKPYIIIQIIIGVICYLSTYKCNKLFLSISSEYRFLYATKREIIVHNSLIEFRPN